MSITQRPAQIDGTTSRSWLVPFLAIAFTVLFVAAFLGGNSGADKDTTGAELIAKHAQSDTATFLTSTAMIVAAIVLIFFGGWLRQTLRSAAARSDWLPDVAFAGAIMHALTLALFVSSAKSVQDAIATGDPVVARALNIADGNNFVIAMLGLACVLIATGVSSFRSRALPRWLAVASIVLGVLAPLGPGGFVPFTLFPSTVAPVPVLMP